MERRSERLIAGVADLDLVDGDGHAPAVGRDGGDQAAALVDLIAVSLQDHLAMHGDRRGLSPEPFLGDSRSARIGTSVPAVSLPIRSRATVLTKPAGLVRIRSSRGGCSGKMRWPYRLNDRRGHRVRIGASPAR